MLGCSPIVLMCCPVKQTGNALCSLSGDSCLHYTGLPTFHASTFFFLFLDCPAWCRHLWSIHSKDNGFRGRASKSVGSCQKRLLYLLVQHFNHNLTWTQRLSCLSVVSCVGSPEWFWMVPCGELIWTIFFLNYFPYLRIIKQGPLRCVAVCGGQPGSHVYWLPAK